MVRLTLSVPVLIALSAVAVACGGPAPQVRAPARTDDAGARARAAFARAPLTFVENRGQSDARVRFQAQGPGHAFSSRAGRSR